jgi:sulfatase modifying factor 1
MKIVGIYILIIFSFISYSQTTKNMVFIQGGTYVPLYSLDSGKVKVASFYMDKYPVTNSEFEKFIAQYPAWRKDKVKPIFADKKYLDYWQFPNKLAKILLVLKNSPVVNVSWFAAKKYCECQGKRLATVDEWEFVALASETKKNASNDSKFYQKILDWYGKSLPNKLPGVGKNFKNIYGVYDIHGLVWEWNLDFISALATKDSRDGNNLDKNEFCGAGSKGAKNPSNYAAFMRYAMRSSLKANYNIPNVGFRCVKDVNK